jgi:23S rRNA (pseudouridine1915-N3)-methyltransferase
MQITILCVGKLKERFYQEAVAEYSKRLSRYTKLTIVEVSDERIPDKAGTAILEQIKEKEAHRLLPHIVEGAYVVTLEIDGKHMSSERFSELIATRQNLSTDRLILIIGGSLGLHELIKKRSDLALSFSDMTFPHQLMRVILCEQLYRAYQILTGGAYHK